MPLGTIEFPPTSVEWTFFVAALVLLVGPIVAERLRLPGIVGVVLGGLLVGPYVLEWVSRDGIVESLGDLGLLYLMFLAGLELDLDEFQRNRRPAVTFGAMTFSFPFVLGLLLVLPFGYGFAAAALYGSLWASHTLVSYPIVQEHGLTSHRAVGMATSGTVMTDTLALSVLAVVAASVESDKRPSIIVVSIIVGLGVLAVYCTVILRRLTRWAFAGLGQQRTARFLFLLVALTSAALVADRAGLEGIIGAFFAGLALNRLVPARSQLMERVEFVGAALLIPFFLLSTGMLIDPKQFTNPRVLGIAAASLAIVLVGKAAAAYLAGRSSGLNRQEIKLVFGLTIAQAAATLAAVTIGVNIGVFDQDLLSAALVVVLVTVIIAGIVTRIAARGVAVPKVAVTPLASTILVPVDAAFDARVARIAARLAMAKGGTVIAGTVASPSETLATARDLARAAVSEAEAAGAEARAVVRVDSSERQGLAGIVVEDDVSLIVLGWPPTMFGVDVVLGGQTTELAALVDVPLLLVSPGQNELERVVLALDRADLRPANAGELELAIAITELAAAAARGHCAVVAPTDEAASAVALRIGADAETSASDSRVDGVAAIARPGDLVVLTSRRDAARIAALPAGCGVAVPVRARTTSGAVTGTPMVLGRRAA
jgi:Kef-type K+ transport system membrane component KefB